MRTINMNEIHDTLNLAEINPEVFAYLCQDIAEETGNDTGLVAGAMFGLYLRQNSTDEAQKSFLWDYCEDVLDVRLV